jgi:hypothetical protein
LIVQVTFPLPVLRIDLRKILLAMRITSFLSMSQMIEHLRLDADPHSPTSSTCVSEKGRQPQKRGEQQTINLI